MINRNVKILLMFLMVLFSAQLNFAQSVEDLLAEGNLYYQNQQYEDALSSYKNIVDQGFESEVLFFNLGNTYFRMNRLGYAILYYEKALVLDPNDEDINYNLKLANVRTVDKISEVPKLFIVEWWDVFVSLLAPSGWLQVVFIFYLVLLFLIGLYFISGRYVTKQMGLYGGTVTLVVLIFLLIVFTTAYSRDTSSEYGILVKSIENVKISPDEKSNDAFVIHEGVKFELEDELQGWTKIKLADGKVGWLPNRSFESI